MRAEPAAELRCPACDGPLGAGVTFHGVDRLHRIAGDFAVSCCAACGTGVTLPPAAAAELASYYPASYGPYDDSLGRITGVVSHAIRWWQGRRALRRPPLRALRDLPAGRAVDVGCGRGDLAGLLVRRGWRVTGIEPSAGACRVARRQGVDVRQGTLAEVDLETGAYDAAIFRHSLEHTSDVAADVAAVVRALKPGGVLLITVPNFACWQRRRFGDSWYHLDLPRHRVHLTPEGLSAVLERAGAEIESLTTSTSTVGLPATLQYRLAGRCLFPDGLSLRVASGLCVLLFPLAWALDRSTGGGDQLDALARRAIAPSTTSAIASAGAG